MHLEKGRKTYIYSENERFGGHGVGNQILLELFATFSISFGRHFHLRAK
jgi:hypothetical protein